MLLFQLTECDPHLLPSTMSRGGTQSGTLLPIDDQPDDHRALHFMDYCQQPRPSSVIAEHVEPSPLIFFLQELAEGNEPIASAWVRFGLGGSLGAAIQSLRTLMILQYGVNMLLLLQDDEDEDS